MNLTAQATAIADACSPAEPKPIRDYSRLSYTEIGLALKLREDGLTQTQIAQRLGCSQPTISTLLSELSDTRQIARLKLNNGAVKLAERVLAQADVDQSLEVLDRLEVATKRQADSGRGNQVNIVIGMPGQAAGPDPVIAISPAPSPLVSDDLHRLTDDQQARGV